MRAIVMLLVVLGAVGCGSSSGDAMGDGGSDGGDAASGDVDAAVDCSLCSPECIGATELSCGLGSQCSSCHPVCMEQPPDLGPPATPNCDAPSGNATCTRGVMIFCVPR